MFEEIEKIISPVYMVGGSVRDELLGNEPKDYDFATPLSPDEIESAVRKVGKRPYMIGKIGKKLGTVGVKTNRQIVEVTTFRQEEYKKGCRRPKVKFVSDITADLSRRDFTINAIAKREGRYIDPFNGKDDLKKKIIRCVGKATARFTEDPLRMLRVARFASQLHFKIDKEITETAKKMSYKILDVSKERWVMEMDILLMTEKPSIVLDFIAETRLLNFMIPELSLQVDYDQNSPYHKLHLWNHTKKVVDSSLKDINLRWAGLLHDIGKPFVRTEKADRSNYIHHSMLGKEMVIKIAHYLRWSRERRENISELVMNHLKDENPLKNADMEAK